MSIKLVADVRVFLIKNLKDILKPHVTADDIAKYTLNQDTEVNHLGEIKRGEDTYSVFFYLKDSLKYRTYQSSLYLTDFIFEYGYEINPEDKKYLVYGDDLKIIRSRETPSGYTLEGLEIENGIDPSTKEFFSEVLSLINKHSKDIGERVLHEALKLLNSK